MRKEHHELRNVISSTLATDTFFKESTLKSIAAAYQHLREVDVFGTVIDGKELFDAASAAYYAKIEKVEGELEVKIREFLEKAEDANEMFRVCARFNALFIRPRISAAVHDYQEQLIATVKKDISVRTDRHDYSNGWSDSFCCVCFPVFGVCSYYKTNSVTNTLRVKRVN